MDHNVRLFAGPKLALRPFLDVLPGSSIYALTPAAQAFVLPVDDAQLDALHLRNGTGEWLADRTHRGATPIGLTTTDLAFSAKASIGSALAYVETNYAGGQGRQCAAVWIDGRSAMRPAIADTSEARPSKLLPINGALRTLGVTARYASPADDEFAAFGLNQYRDNVAIRTRALAVRL